MVAASDAAAPPPYSADPLPGDPLLGHTETRTYGTRPPQTAVGTRRLSAAAIETRFNASNLVASRRNALLANGLLVLFTLLSLQLVSLLVAPHKHRGNPFTRPGQILYACPALDRGVALTFDDGPSATTPELLDSLRELGVKATFFVVGINAVQAPDVLRRMVAEGHTIGSHTYSHANLTDLFARGNTSELAFQIEENERIIKEITGRRPYLLRPPYGAVSAGVRRFLEKRGYTIVMWNAGCIDWWMDDPGREIPIYVNGFPDAGSILCMHDTVASTSRSAANLTRALVGTDGPFANPQGRRILSMAECVEEG
ncbi:hypothetical protein DFJ74DRAFT_600762 [Hyaloraphidium curvatum]|nr:hypothetical protein DFJ74DRAFT_600762 [Hyaloraphidium curvatum]